LTSNRSSLSSGPSTSTPPLTRPLTPPTASQSVRSPSASDIRESSPSAECIPERRDDLKQSLEADIAEKEDCDYRSFHEAIATAKESSIKVLLRDIKTQSEVQQTTKAFHEGEVSFISLDLKS
jgi:hypothetical protein